MSQYFRDRVAGALHGQNRRFYRAVAPDGTVRMEDFSLDLLNNIMQEGDPVSAGNLNFASGNVELMVANGQDIRRGQLVTFTAVGASVANITRPLAATLTQGSTTYLHSALKLSNGRVLLVLHTVFTTWTRTDAVVAELDWVRRTVELGAAVDLGAADAVEVINAASFGVLRGTQLILCTVSGRTVTQHQAVQISSFTGVTNIARAGGDSVLAVNRTENNWEAREWRISGNSFVLAGTRATFDLTADPRRLYAVNGLPGRFILYRRVNTSTGLWSVNTIGFPTASSVSLGENPGNANDIRLPRTHGAGQFLTANSEHMFYSHWSGGRFDIRVLSINRATGALSVGAARTMPVLAEPDHTVDSAGNMAMIGPVSRGGATELAFFGGISAAQATETQPFRGTRLSTDTHHAHFGLAVENDANPGEYLFMQHHRIALTGGWQPAQLSFGFRGDSANSGSVAGVALADAAGGRVRVQVSGKHLPGLWAGLAPGRLYEPGANGGLAAQWVPTAATVGVAAGSAGIFFYGAKAWGI